MNSLRYGWLRCGDIARPPAGSEQYGRAQRQIAARAGGFQRTEEHKQRGTPLNK